MDDSDYGFNGRKQEHKRRFNRTSWMKVIILYAIVSGAILYLSIPNLALMERDGYRMYCSLLVWPAMTIRPGAAAVTEIRNVTTINNTTRDIQSDISKKEVVHIPTFEVVLVFQSNCT